MAIKSDIRIISRVVPRERDGKYVPRSVTIIQGGGGGQPHFASAGGKNTDGLNAAIDKVVELAKL